MSKFKFELKAAIVIAISGEHGIVKSRMESSDTKNQYSVSYVSGFGCSQDRWFYESELKLKPAEKKPAPVRNKVIKAMKKITGGDTVTFSKPKRAPAKKRVVKKKAAAAVPVVPTIK